MKHRIGFPQILFAAAGEGASAPASTPSAPAGGGGVEAPAAAPSSTPAAATPSSAPTPASGETRPPDGATPGGAVPPSSDAPGVDAFEFDGLEGDDGLDLDTILPSPATPKAPVVPAAAAPPVTPPAPQAATATPGAPVAAPAPGPQGETPQLPSPAEPDKIASMMETDSVALIDHLAQNEFKLSQEDIEALETNASEFIPKLLARTFYRAQVSTLKQLSRVVPAMLESITKVKESNSKNEGKFFARWPALKADEHSPLVRRLAQTYRQMNPTAPLEQMVEELGPIVMMAAKIPAGAEAPATNGAGGTPAFSPSRTSSPPPPFRPAMGGSAAPPAPGGTDDNPWGGLAGAQDDE